MKDLDVHAGIIFPLCFHFIYSVQTVYEKNVKALRLKSFPLVVECVWNN